MAKKFLYKGRTFEELQKMSLEEFMALLPSRERRALKRGFTEDEKTLLQNIRHQRDRFHKTHAREMVVIPEMVGIKMGVYNGKEFVTVTLHEDMIGHRLGEFAATRKQVKHSAPGVGATRSSKYIPLK